MASHAVLDREQGTEGKPEGQPAGQPAGATAPETCLNCGTALTGPYCASCGQRKPHLDPTLRDVLHESAQELTNWDGKVPTTLKALFLRPGVLTVDFLAGRRARWIPPLRLYLICSIAFFLAKPVIEAATGRPLREGARITITNADGTRTLTPEERREVAEGLPGRIFGVERLERAAANGAQLNRTIDTAFPKAMFLILPFFAFLTSLAWKRAQPRYPAHLYTALHLHAAWFGAFTLAMVAAAIFPSDTGEALIGLGAVGYITWYSLSALRRVFGESWWKTIAKTAAISVVYCAALFVTSLLTLAYALATM